MEWFSGNGLQVKKVNNKMKLGYGIVTFALDFKDTLENVKNALGHVDEIVIVQDGSFTEEMKEAFMKLFHPDTTINIVYKAWDDNFPAYRNASLENARQLGCEWICYDEQTEILTENGFKRFADLDKTEKVLTMNPETFELEYQLPSEYINIPYDGEMLHWKGAPYDIKVTPNHKMFVALNNLPSHYRFIEAQELANYSRFWFQAAGERWQGVDIPLVNANSITGKHLLQEQFISNDAVVQLLGWYLGDGWSYKNAIASTNFSRCKIQFSDPKPESQEELKNLATRFGRSMFLEKGRKWNDTLTMYHKPFFDFVHPLGKAWEKYIPKQVKNLPAKYLELLLGAYLKADGSRYQKSFVTVSKRLADDLQEICIKIGLRCVIHEADRTGQKGGINNRGQQIISRRKIYVGSISENRHSHVRSSREHQVLTREEYHGNVFCVTVPNHVICVRRNGKVAFSGNCISDSDEFYSKETWEDLKEKLIPDAESKGVDMLGLRCKDAFQVVDWLPFDELDKLKELPGGDARESTWYKNLIFKLYPDVDYSGSGGTEGIGGALKTTFECETCGSEEVDYIGSKSKTCAKCKKEMKVAKTQELKLHEIWGSRSRPWKSQNLPDPYHYTHRKSTYRIFRNSARNLVMTGGGCVSPSTRVITERGLIPASEIKVGDIVINKDGDLTKVASAQMVDYVGGEIAPVFSFRPRGGTSVEVTENERIEVFEISDGRVSDEYWIPAREYKQYYFGHDSDRKTGHMMKMPIVKVPPYEPENDLPEYWYFIGYWIADGSTYQRRDGHWETEISANPAHLAKLKSIIRNVLGISALEHSDKRSKNYIGVRFSKADFGRYIINEFGHGFAGKRIPFKYLGLPKNLLSALINGLFDGDGTHNHKRERILNVANSQVATFAFLALQELGYSPSINPLKMYKNHFGKSLLYRVVVSDRKLGEFHNANAKLFDGEIYVHAENKGALLMEDYQGKVVDINVQEGESFCTPYCVIHNDSVGKLNSAWLELRAIMDKLGIPDWPSFEKYVQGHGDIEPFRDWIRRGLVFSATDFGTEVRETCKYLIFNYRFLVDDPKIKYGLDNPPKPSPETETEVFVRKMYYKVLARHPDRGGLDNYTKQIIEGKLKKEQLELALRSSDEYKEKFGEKEKVKLQLPIEVTISVSEDMFVEVLTRSEIYAKVIKPRMDIGKKILDGLGSKKEEFLEWYYKEGKALDYISLLAELRNLGDEKLPAPLVCSCGMTYEYSSEEAEEHAKKLGHALLV